MGFGLPCTLLMRYSPFFVGLGIYLTLFPFIIVLSGVTRPEESIQIYESPAHPITPLPVFMYPKRLALYILRRIDSYVRKDKNN